MRRAVSASVSHHRWIIGRSRLNGGIKISGLSFTTFRKRIDLAFRMRWIRIRMSRRRIRTRMARRRIRTLRRAVYNIQMRSLSGDRDNRRGGSYHRCDGRSYENEYDGEFVMNHVEYEFEVESIWRPAQKWCVDKWVVLKWVPDWRKSKLRSTDLLYQIFLPDMIW